METKKALLILIVPLLFTACTTPKPPLTDGEIPWRLSPGVYAADDGTVHKVTSDTPRWSVSEAYLLQSYMKSDSSPVVSYIKDNTIPIIIAILLIYLLFNSRKSRGTL